MKSSTVAGTSEEWLLGVIPLAHSGAVLRLLDCQKLQFITSSECLQNSSCGGLGGVGQE